MVVALGRCGGLLVRCGGLLARLIKWLFDEDVTANSLRCGGLLVRSRGS